MFVHGLFGHPFETWAEASKFRSKSPHNRSVGPSSSSSGASQPLERSFEYPRIGLGAPLRAQHFGRGTCFPMRSAMCESSLGAMMQTSTVSAQLHQAPSISMRELYYLTWSMNVNLPNITRDLSSSSCTAWVGSSLKPPSTDHQRPKAHG